MMAGDWIKMRTDLRTHPKVARIASALKADRLRVIGGLHAVWCLFDVHSVDGILDGYTIDTLDDELRWPGFSAAMIAIEWLEDHGDSLSTPRFDEHNGQSAKRRAQEAERKRNERKASASPSASDADKKRTREEKRREDTEEPKPLGASAPGGVERRQGNLEAIEGILPAGPASLPGPPVPPVPPPADPVPPKPPKADDVAFEQAWALYPKRDGGNPRKEALAAWNARIKEGVSAEDMIAGLQRYTAHMKARGKIGTPYVMQGSTFFGPSARYAEAWDAQQAPAQRANGRPSINSFGPGHDPGNDDPFNDLRRAP